MRNKLRFGFLIWIFILINNHELISQNEDCWPDLQMFWGTPDRTPLVQCFPLEYTLQPLGVRVFQHPCGQYTIDNPHGFFVFVDDIVLTITNHNWFGSNYQLFVHGPINECLPPTNEFFLSNCPIAFHENNTFMELNIPLPQGGGLYFIVTDGIAGSLADVNISVKNTGPLSKRLSLSSGFGSSNNGINFTLSASYSSGSQAIVHPNFSRMVRECIMFCNCEGGGAGCDISEPIEILSISHPPSWLVTYQSVSNSEEFRFRIDNINESGTICVAYRYDTCEYELCLPVNFIEETVYKCPNMPVRHRGRLFQVAGTYFFSIFDGNLNIYQIHVIDRPPSSKTVEEIFLCDGEVYIAPDGRAYTQNLTRRFYVQNATPCPDTLDLFLRFIKLDINIHISNEITCDLDSAVVTPAINVSIQPDSLFITVINPQGDTIYEGVPSAFVVRDTGIYFINIQVYKDSVFCEFFDFFAVPETLNYRPSMQWNQLDSLVCKGEVAVLHYGDSDVLQYIISDGNLFEVQNNHWVSPILDESLCLQLVFQNLKGKCTYTENICLDIMESDSIDLGTIQICAGDTLRVGGETFTTDGTFVVHSQNKMGCDSLIYFQVNTFINDTIKLKEAICFGTSFEFQGIAYHESGVYNVLLSDQQGCDSIIQLDIRAIPLDTLYREALHCPAATYTIRDTLTVAQLPYQFVFDSIPDEGCPIIIIETHEIFNQVEISAEIGHACPGTADAYIRLSYADPSDSGIQYKWDPEVSNDHMAESIVAGIYHVTITDSLGCEQYLHFTIDEKPIPPFSVEGKAETCPGFEDARIVVQGDDIIGIHLNGAEQLELNVHNLRPGNHEVTILFSNGCVVTEYIRLVSGLEIEYTLPDTLYAHRRDIGAWLSIPVIWNDVEDLAEVRWQSMLPLSCIDCLSPNVKVLETGEVRLTLTSNTGCLQTDHLIIFLEESIGQFFPDAFSPNGDGINDSWDLFGDTENISELRVQIFNRWGVRIMDNKLDKPFKVLWDGTHNDEICPPDTYVYLVEWVDEMGNQANKFGSITILR